MTKLRNSLFVISLFFISACAVFAPVNLFVSSEGYKIIEDISYTEGARHKLDIYIPDKKRSDKKVLVFIYGGRWEWGRKQDYRFVGEAFANKGYIVVIPDYRIHPTAKFPDFIEDTAKAVKWTHNNIKNYGGSPDKIYMAGHSAGAYNAMMVALNSEYLEKIGASPKIIKAVAGIAGPYDFLPFTDEVVKKVFSSAKDQKITQPINFARRDAPPILLLHGAEDKTVLPKNSNNLYAKLIEKGAKAEKIIYPGLDHVDVILALSTPFSGKGELQKDITDFFEKY